MECEVTAPTMTDLTTVDSVEVSIEQMAREAQKSGLADDIVTGQLLGTESYSVNNDINTDSTDEEDQDPFHNSDDDEVDPDYNTLNSGSEIDSEIIEIKSINKIVFNGMNNRERLKGYLRCSYDLRLLEQNIPNICNLRKYSFSQEIDS
ncbi:hypothetical protein Avbf_05945 [Armadillidium vulgare]|nr:hypothetical protein Avbf_05945 [Armadillidium vulgare]